MIRPQELVDELADYFDFLKEHMPFSDLPPEVLAQIVRRLEVSYFRSGADVFPIGATVKELYVVRKGAVEIADDEGVLVAREGEGDCFGYPALLTGGTARREARCVEDTLLYAIPSELFHQLRGEHPTFDRFFGVAHESRLRQVVEEDGGGAEGLLAHQVTALVRRAPVFVTPDTTIRAAAETMTSEKISSVVVLQEGRLEGILTDRDLRTRVIVAGRSVEGPVSEVMTASPFFVDAGDRALEALLMMTRYRVHHLPVVDDGEVKGVVTATDLLRVQAAHPVYMVGEIHKQTDTAGLAQVARRLPGVVQRLAQAGVRAAEVGRVVTFLADAITERLITLAEEELGPAPARYAWVGLGSQGRNELGLSSDQDNALVLEDGAEAHDAYFERMALRVTTGLDECGFPTCPGDVMATNPTWRQPVSVWARYFSEWIETPSAKALLNASVYFDMRTVHGDDDLVRKLQRGMLPLAQRNQRFLANLARAALEHRPPLGFFRQFVLDVGGAEGKALDLKHRGIAPVVGLARVYALSCGSEEVETRERIRDAVERKGLTDEDAACLLDAHAFISKVRLRHQARQLGEGVKPDNFVSPDSLSSFERTHLKDAFRVVGTLQSGLEYRFKTGMLG